MLIGQEIGVEHLMPLALEMLRENPLAEGDCYPGDLLVNVLSVTEVFWQQNPDWQAEVASIGKQTVEGCNASHEFTSETMPKVIRESVEEFLRKTQRVES